MKANQRKTKKRMKERITKEKMDKAVAKRAMIYGGGKETGAEKGEEDFRAAFMKNIMIKRRELERALERLMDSQREYDVQSTKGDFIDEFDEAQREISARSHHALIDRKIKQLQKIEYLINSIPQDEEFGRCEECGKRIPKERLMIVPEATLCVSCQRKLERLDSQKSISERRPASYVGGSEEMKWENTDIENEARKAMETSIDNLSLTDLEETESDNSI